MKNKIRNRNETKLIAFYLPQFHPIPENDKWWGKGFTEWAKVAKAKPLFRGHYQPHIPADLGFYDLRLPEVREAQAELAREYGIFGFCYYHYWFNGKLLLERPFNEVLNSGKPDFPFCLCWANEDWTKAWDGKTGDKLLEQHYSEEDDLKHVRWLATAFRDPRYIRVDGKPLFLVYRSGLLPDPLKTTTVWREESKKSGFGDIYLCRVESFAKEKGIPPQSHGFDAAVDFQPDWSNLGKPSRRSVWWRLLRFIGVSERAYEEHRIYDYQEIVERMEARPSVPYKRFPCVIPSWDNSARRSKDAVVLKDSFPEIYGKWLKSVMGNEEGLVFINAWNEWAEGNHLEPDQKFGRNFLEETLSALRT